MNKDNGQAAPQAVPPSNILWQCWHCQKKMLIAYQWATTNGTIVLVHKTCWHKLHHKTFKPSERNCSCTDKRKAVGGQHGT